MSVQAVAAERGPEDVADVAGTAVEPAEHRVDGRRIVGIERHAAPTYAAGKIARDVGEREPEGADLAASASVDTNTLSADGDDDVVAVGRRDVDVRRVPAKARPNSPVAAAVGALPEVLVAAGVDDAAGAGVGRQRRRDRSPHRSPCPSGVISVGEARRRWSSARCGCMAPGPEAAAVDLPGGHPVVDHVPAVAALRRESSRADRPARVCDPVVLQRAEGDAGRGVGPDVEVVEQRGLQAAGVERGPGGAAVRGAEEAAVVAAEDDRRRRGRLREEGPRVVVGVQPAQAP